MDKNTIVLIIGAILAGGYLLYPAYIGGGFATIALSQTKFVSSDPDLNGDDIWQLTAIQNTQGEHAVGEISADEITDGQKKAKHGLKIEMFVDEQYVTYPVTKNTDYRSQFHSVNYKTEIINHFDFDEHQIFRDNCNARPTALYITMKSLGIFTGKEFTCYWRFQDATLGTVTRNSINFKSTIKATVNNEVVKGIVSNTAPSSVKLKNPNTGEHLVHVSWLGNLVSGTTPPAPSAFNLVGYRNGWRNIDDQRYNTYKNYYEAGFENCISRYMNYGTESPSSCTATWNSLERDAFVNSPVSFGGQKASSTGSETDGKFIIQLAKQIQYPMITLKVKADWLGVFIPIGEPTILSATALGELQTGTTGYITVAVKNIGNGLGAFEVYASCTGVSAGATQYLNLEPNAQGTVYIPITGSSSTKKAYSCTVNTRDRNSGEMATPKTVSGYVTPIIICTTGDKKIDGPYIKECNTDGSDWDTIETCTGDTTPKWVDGTPKCVKDDSGNGGGGGGRSCDQINPVDKAVCEGIQTLKMVAGVIVGIVIIVIGGYLFVTIVIRELIDNILGR